LHHPRSGAAFSPSAVIAGAYRQKLRVSAQALLSVERLPRPGRGIFWQNRNQQVTQIETIVFGYKYY